jgi:hypothetical protein
MKNVTLEAESGEFQLVKMEGIMAYVKVLFRKLCREYNGRQREQSVRKAGPWAEKIILHRKVINNEFQSYNPTVLYDKSM